MAVATAESGWGDNRCMATDPAATPASEPVEPLQPPPADQDWLEVENVRGDDPLQEGTWPFEPRG